VKIFWVSRGDLAVGTAVTALTVVPVLVPYLQPWWVVVLAAGASVPLLWRRRAMMAAGFVAGGATTALALVYKSLAHEPPLLLPYGVLVWTYTFAAEGVSRARRVVGVVFLVVGVGVSLVVPHESLETFRYLITAIVAAYAVGIGVRARRAGREAVRERERRIEEERATAAERERIRIARDMHDVLTHSVGLMVVQAEAGPLHGDPERAAAAFDAIAGTGRDAIGQLRLILGALRGEGHPGLEAVPDLVAGARRAGLDASAEVRGEPGPLAPDVDIAAYRVIQEALTNTIRHARARTVRVRLDWSGGTLGIVVADDGRSARDVREGHGIIGMRERVTACGGTLTVRSRESGFTVSATLPIG
jgi:signal transduction histidine kinase